jgi:hypothetical protein
MGLVKKGFVVIVAVLKQTFQSLPYALKISNTMYYVNNTNNLT